MAASLLSTDEDGVLAEINMTPLVDVMLVLLIIFMVTMPVLTQQIRVELPAARSASTASPQESVSLQVTEAGTVLWDQREVGAEELQQLLSASAAQDPQPVVQLSGDRAVPYGEVMRVMDMIRTAGVASLAFVTRPG